MGDRFDVVDLIDESGWPYADEVAGARTPEPADPRSAPDDDLVALHALRHPAVASLSDAERAAVAARFGLGGGPPLTMVELGTALGLSRDRTRVVLSSGLAKLRTALADE
jgi:DNA-directed RNA polymerase sigma subunit (sigma70/sigma32)